MEIMPTIIPKNLKKELALSLIMDSIKYKNIMNKFETQNLVFEIFLIGYLKILYLFSVHCLKDLSVLIRCIFESKCSIFKSGTQTNVPEAFIRAEKITSSKID